MSLGQYKKNSSASHQCHSTNKVLALWKSLSGTVVPKGMDPKILNSFVCYLFLLVIFQIPLILYLKLTVLKLYPISPPLVIVRLLYLLLPENVAPFLLVFYTSCHYTPVCTITVLDSLQTISLFCSSQISQGPVQCLCIIGA